jgi:phage recombination protein Bet
MSLLAKFASRYSVEPNKMLSTLKATAFRQQGDVEITNEQMMSLLIVADQYGLNPFTKELYAFPDRNGGIVPVVSIDGWARIINEQAQMDGIEFVYADDNDKWEGHDVPLWCEAVIYRKDRKFPTRIRERFKEVRRNTQPWKSHPTRMMRHKALIQCARIAFGFGGIYDDDEGAQIIQNQQAAPQIDEFVVLAKQAPAIENKPSDVIEHQIPATAMDATVVHVAPTIAKGAVTIGADDLPSAGAPPINEAPAAGKPAVEPLAQPQTQLPPSPAGGVSPSEYAYLQRKSKALGVNLAELASDLQLNMQTLTKDGFNALKVALVDIERQGGD